MEIDITLLVSDDVELMDYSASCAELGDRAGKITWNNSKESGHIFVRTEEEKQEARNYIREFGAWDKEEIDGWSDTELNALILQMIAGDLREYLEAKERPDFARWEENNGGRIFESGDKFYYYLGL